MDTKNTKITTEAEYDGSDRDLNSRILARYNEHFKAQDEYLHKQMRKIKERIDYLDRRVSKLPTKVDWRPEDVLLGFIMAILIVCAAGAAANELMRFSAWMKGSVGQPGQLTCNETELILLHDHIAEINRDELRELEKIVSQNAHSINAQSVIYVSVDHRARNDSIDYYVTIVHCTMTSGKYSVNARLSISTVDPLKMRERMFVIFVSQGYETTTQRHLQLIYYELILTRYGIPFTKTTP